ncbi:MAG: CRISPR-associated helicase Cas3' [Chloroflexota bacterium]
MAGKQLRRSQLIHELERLYSERAWGDAELAERFNMDRTTVYKTRRFMEEQLGLPFLEERRGRYRLDPEHRLSNLRLTPAEALALYLGGRRLQQQTRTGQQPVAVALEKLAQALRQPMMENLTRVARSVLEQEQDPQQVAVMEKLVEGWITGRKVRIWHQVLHGVERQYVVSPYQLEPAVWGDGVYLIGHSEFHGGPATFKVARIRRAAVTTEPFTIPDDFDSQALLAHAWGIWRADRPPETVRLRFSVAVTPRVKESIWHPSQTIRDQPDGGCIWEAQIAEVREMESWVRGWGADVEVLGPEELREKMIRVSKNMANLYQLNLSLQRRPYQWLYAKTARENRDQIHLLLYHLIDVGTVAHEMWHRVFTTSFRRQIADLLGTTLLGAGRFVAFMAAMHDLGKAGPAYQNKYAPPWLRDKFKEIGLLVEPHHYNIATQQCPHATVTAWALPNLLMEYEGYDDAFARKISVALGGHHGNWPGPFASEGIDDEICALWEQIRRDLYWELRAVFPPPQVTPDLAPDALNTLITLLSGLTSIADWVGSNAKYFELKDEVIGTREYATKTAVLAAHNALQKLGWMGWEPTGVLRDFAQSYAYLSFDKPHTVQQEIIDAAGDAPAPTLLLIEAPTGIGKTETAQYLTDIWLQKHKGRGFYIAMPTQATSNQMYDRTIKFLTHNYPDDLLNIPLAHGNAIFEPKQADIRLNEVGDDKATGVVAMSWFVQKSKQTLLAPFGVGTVDQALLGVLQTRHFFVRLLGLSQKVIIFDEIHAYDTYMSTLFERLLSWLKVIGTSVIMLSATLPVATRQKFVKAYTGQDLPLDPANPLPYPALTIAPAGQPPRTIPLTKPADHLLYLNWLDDGSPEFILGFLQAELANGGCAAVICNTVGRAQIIFTLLDEARQQGILDIQEENLLLFHARFPFSSRKPIEEAVLAKFGKPDKDKGDRRPKPNDKAIVVATQVIEQSLDLDFDVMVTELAPVDLLLQRAGRLHRHSLRDEKRHHARQLTIVPPALLDGLPTFGVDEWIYERYLLLQTYRLLHERRELIIPKETAMLIEAVYADAIHDDDTAWHNALQAAYQKMLLDRRVQSSKAKRSLIKPPEDYRLLTQTILGLEEDNPAVHETFQAKTRDIAPGITLICLFQAENGVRLDPDDPTPPFDHWAPLTDDRASTLWQNNITVQNWTLVRHFGPREETVPPTWREHPVLRYSRPVLFVDGVYRFHHDGKSYELRLSQKLGLQLVNLSKENV